MADMVRSGEGWRVSPADYATTRPATFGVGPPRSQYVTMRDGCRLALDVYLPQRTRGSDAPRARLPTILILTPYYRRFKLRPGAPSTTEPSPNAGKWRDLFVPRGYAVVVCDVRGTGTSARMAQWAALGKLREGQDFVHESIIGSEFVGRIAGRTKVGDKDAIVPTIQGWARVTGFNTIFVDDRDPYWRGFQVADKVT